jgi:hypothetical protein
MSCLREAQRQPESFRAGSADDRDVHRPEPNG